MDFIIGGAYQGKKEYARQQYGFTETDFVDGKTMNLEPEGDIRAVYSFQLWIKRLFLENMDPLEQTKKLLEKNPKLVILMDEVGNGIVPLDKKERLWREQVGKTGCYLAREASQVVRLVCGLPQRLK